MSGDGSTELSAFAGQVLVVVGPNGSGKSALSHWLSVNRASTPTPVVRVVAHRRLWLKSAGTEMTTSQREQNVSSFAHWDSLPNSRVVREGDEQRSAKLIYDLLARVNGRNARIAELVDTHEDVSSVEESILTKIGRVFAAAHLGMAFRVTDTGTFDAVRQSDVAYPVMEMSDGEKGAFLLTTEVLLSPPGSVQLVDEPERHLHRAISSDFIAALMLERPDCAFVLFTHDLDVINKLEPTSTTVCTVSAVSWDGGLPSGWALHVDPQRSGVPDTVRQAILGGRTRLLCVEGQASSLDYPLYRLVFPDWTVVPCGGAEEVKRTVIGLQGTHAFHWVDGRGVLDGDARTPAEIAALAAKRIRVLPVNEVENLYYLSYVVDAVAENQAAALGENGPELTSAARENAMRSLTEAVCQHLAAVNAVKTLRSKALASLPTTTSIISGGNTLSVDFTSPYPAQYQELVERRDTQDYDGIVLNYSVRDSGFLKAVALALGFQSRDQYEKAVRVHLQRDSELLAKVRGLIGDLPG